MPLPFNPRDFHRVRVAHSLHTSRWSFRDDWYWYPATFKEFVTQKKQRENRALHIMHHCNNIEKNAKDCLITLWPQGVFLVSNVTYLIMQTMLEMTFLLLVTINIVWYVFSAFNSLFLFDGGRTPVVKIWIFLGVLSCILLTVALLCERD